MKSRLLTAKKSIKIVENNWQAIDATFDALTQVEVPAEWATLELPEEKADTATKPSYITNILEPINRQEGNDLSVGDLIDYASETKSMDYRWRWLGL